MMPAPSDVPAAKKKKGAAAANAAAAAAVPEDCHEESELVGPDQVPEEFLTQAQKEELRILNKGRRQKKR